MKTGATIALCIILLLGYLALDLVKCVDPTPLDEVLQSELSTWIEQEGKLPEAYVLDLFDEHSVIFLGEFHRIRHDLQFVQSLLEPLYNRGVRTLGTEFSRSEDQFLIDSLLSATEWNEDLARHIIFQHYVWWGFQDYVDVFHAAWTLNQKLPDGAPLFQILGLNGSCDWSLMKTQADRDNPKIRRQIWKDGGDAHLAKVILGAVQQDEKVLVHCGIHHAFTKYRQPIVMDGKFVRFDSDLRCGNHVHATLGEKTKTIFLHSPWYGEGGYDSPMQHPADGVIDALMMSMGPHPVGFDVQNSPFGSLRIEKGVYQQGYKDFKLSDYCDGWIYTKHISEYEGVTSIPNWVNENNLFHAQQQSPNPRHRNVSAEVFNRGIERQADIQRLFHHLN